MQNSRRLFLAGGGLTALAAATGVPARALASQDSAEVPVSRTRWASEFGAVGNGKADDTAALTTGLQWAAEQRAVLLLDPGFYAVGSIDIPSQAVLRGVAGGHSRFGRDGRQVPAVLVPRPGSSDSAPVVTLSGTGARLEGVGVMGGTGDDPSTWADRPAVVVRGGIEVVLSDVRVFRFAATGIRIEQLNNARWTGVFVDDCGTKQSPAVRIESVGCTNYVHFDGLTIERSANTALDIATGTDPVRDWVSNILFTGLHVESNADGASKHELNSHPLIDIGNVRAVTFMAPQVLGRPAALVRYQQQIPASLELSVKPGGDARDQQGGVQVIGGNLKQHGGDAAGAARVATIELAGNGRGFAVTSVKFDSLWCPGVLVRKEYQHDVLVHGCTFRRASAEAGWPESVTDEREAGVRRSNANVLHGWHRLVGGQLVLDGGLALLAAAKDSRTALDVPPLVSAGWVMPSQGPGTDLAGRLWCRVSAEVMGRLVSVRFAVPKGESPIVQLTPRNASAARARVFIDVQVDAGGSTTGFAVHSTEAVAEAAGVLLFDYVVVDRGR